MVAKLSMKTYERCHLPLICPWESFAQSMFSQQYLTTSVSGWMGHVPRQPVLCCLNSLVSPEKL